MKRVARHFQCAIAALATSMCAMMLCAGCGRVQSAASESALTASPARPSGAVDVWSWNIAAKSLQSLVPAYRADAPDVHVSIDMTGASMSTRLMLSLAANVGAPDVSTLLLTDAPRYIATHRLTDLTAVAGQYRDQFPPSRLAPCMMNGHIYAIPWDMGPCAVFYKRHLLAKYGIDPETIQTWDDYVKAGQVIDQKSGGRTKMLPLASDDAEIMLEMLVQQTQGQFFDGQGRVAIDSPQVRLAVDTLRKLRQSGICADVPAYGQEWMTSFSDDSIATYPNAVWLAGLIKDATGDVPGKKSDWGVFRLPAVTPGGLRVADLGGSVLVIPASCSNKQAAWSFVRYALCTRQAQLSQYKHYDLYPSYLPALASPEMDEPDPFFAGQRVGRFFAWNVDQIWPLNIPPSWQEAKSYVQQDLSGWMSGGMGDESVLLRNLARKLHDRLELPLAPASVLASRNSTQTIALALISKPHKRERSVGRASGGVRSAFLSEASSPRSGAGSPADAARRLLKHWATSPPSQSSWSALS